MYDDGKDSIEEIVETAIEKGFSVLGFSGHAYTFFDPSYCMNDENAAKYFAAVKAAKAKYADKIEIHLGLELDYNGQKDYEKVEYIIGSVHNVYKDGKYLLLDEALSTTKRIIAEDFGGDAYAMCEMYFETLAKVYDATHCDIIGHFDLITKFQQQEQLFDEHHPRYVKAWQKTADTLLKTGAVFEMNTGAISRGYRTTPYPSDDIIKYLHERGAKFILSSDCHEKDALDCGFDELKKKYGDILIDSIF